MRFPPRTRVAVVTGPGPQITGTVVRNDDRGIEVRLDSGETILGNAGDFYELTDDLGRVMVEIEPVERPAVGLIQFAESLDPSFKGFYTWGPVFLTGVNGGGPSMTALTIDLATLVQTYRIGLQNASDWEVDYEAQRNATLPRSPLADEMRHLVEAEIERRRAEQHAADSEPDLPPLPKPANPPQLPPTWPATGGLAELHTDTVAMIEASRAERAALERAAAEARRVSTVTPLRAVA